MALEKLCDDYNTTKVRHNRWVGRHNGPHGETLTLIFSNSSMALIPCLEKMNSIFSLIYKGENIYIYAVVLGQNKKQS